MTENPRLSAEESGHKQDDEAQPGQDNKRE